MSSVKQKYFENCLKFFFDHTMNTNGVQCCVYPNIIQVVIFFVLCRIKQIIYGLHYIWTGCLLNFTIFLALNISIFVATMAVWSKLQFLSLKKRRKKIHWYWDQNKKFNYFAPSNCHHLIELKSNRDTECFFYTHKVMSKHCLSTSMWLWCNCFFEKAGLQHVLHNLQITSATATIQLYLFLCISIKLFFAMCQAFSSPTFCI